MNLFTKLVSPRKMRGWKTITVKKAFSFLGIKMPSFNKGIYKNFNFEAMPANRKFPVISSIMRWYRPYSPGEKIDFDIITQSLVDNNEYGIYGLFFQENGGICERIQNVHVKANKIKNVEKFSGKNLSGQGSFDYRIGLSAEDSVVIISIVATHNDTWMLLVAGGIITLILSFGLYIVTSMIQVDPIWHIINPFW